MAAALVPGFSLEEVRPNEDDFAWIKDKMHNSIRVHDNSLISTYEICKVFRVNNARLWNLYTLRRILMQAEMGGQQHVEEVRLFHGTSDAEAIIQNGFDLNYADPNGMFGQGIYFSDLSSKSNQYTEGWTNPCGPHNLRMCPHCVRQMLICRVALGNKFRTTQPTNGVPRGYHSIEALPSPGGLTYPEYIIYNNHQAYPGFLVQYKIKQVIEVGGKYYVAPQFYR